MSRKNPAELGIWKAIWNAFTGKPTDFYPRVKDGDGPIQTLKTEDILKEFGIAAKDWASVKPGTELDAAIDLARQSLNEVKGQTEYQDQKAGRLLTVATILSALSGLLFVRFNDSYPVQSTLATLGAGKLLVLTSYVPFAAFVLAVLFGALVTFHATRTRFKYDDENEKASADEGSAKSRLFYIPILGVRPRAWAESFVARQRTGKSAAIIVEPELQQLYFRDLVGETYLVAAKTADKIRYLEEAQSLFAWALRFLLLWLLMLTAVSLMVVPTAPQAKPTQVQLVPSHAPGRETAVQQKPSEVLAAVKSQAPVDPVKGPQAKGRLQ